MTQHSTRVYSTDIGRIKPSDAPEKNSPPTDGILRIYRETKGRGGKCVTVIRGFAISAESQKELCKKLKQLCATGGSTKQHEIEIQGDHREKIRIALETQGFNVKLAGG